MTSGPDDADDVIRPAWATEQPPAGAPDEDCGPTRVCRNARDFTFDGFAEDGGDLPTAWRETLAREGKLDEAAESVRDLVFGRADVRVTQRSKARRPS